MSVGLENGMANTNLVVLSTAAQNSLFVRQDKNGVLAAIELRKTWTITNFGQEAYILVDNTILHKILLYYPRLIKTVRVKAQSSCFRSKLKDGSCFEF